MSLVVRFLWLAVGVLLLFAWVTAQDPTQSFILAVLAAAAFFAATIASCTLWLAGVVRNELDNQRLELRQLVKPSEAERETPTA